VRVSEDRGGNDPTELRTRLLQYRASLFDPVTQLPTLPVVMDRVRRLLDDKGTVPVFLIRVEHEQHLERVVGWERYDRLLGSVAGFLGDVLARTVRCDVILCQEAVRGDVFIIFLADRSEAGRLQTVLSDGISVSDDDSGEESLMALQIGRGLITRRPSERTERAIYNGIHDARQDFHKRGEVLDEARLVEARRILRDRSVTTLFQPILGLPERQVLGFEALSRGPSGSYLEPAENLFGFADRSGLLGEVERLCVELALQRAARLPADCMLFINLSNHGLEHLDAVGTELAALFEGSGLTPRDCVLEITERTYAESQAVLNERVRRLRLQGFRIAIDDMGTGYSALHVLAELKPDFIKLNHLLVRGLPRAPIKRNLVSAITSFAAAAQSVVIAEGVEREDESRALVELGVMLQQGFHFGHPRQY
jgi:EAL domain-containing protein (putative c-di-GMP-specific phosphodiesterase class I)/GGDEF domain-containing protein